MPHSLDKSVVLVGMPGAGKSTVGRQLAGRLGVDFVDCDEAIEAVEGLTVAEIFACFGEPHFRACERQAIARLIAGPPRVIAAGGGAFLDQDTRRHVLEMCIAIWLDTEVEVLVNRIGASDDRPLLRDRDVEARVTELCKHRHPVYAEAHVRIVAAALPVDTIVDRIVEALSERPA
jgi:shikimate kinase